VAREARHVVGDHQPVARREAMDPGAHRDDVIDHLVAQHHGRGRGRGDLQDVRAAEAAAAQAQE
jgi:hypothetical protein